MEENVSGCFFSEHSVVLVVIAWFNNSFRSTCTCLTITRTNHNYKQKCKRKQHLGTKKPANYAKN